MGDEGLIPRLCNVRTLLGVLAGVGASYGIYKLVSRSEEEDEEEEEQLRPGTLLSQVSGLKVVQTGEVQATPPGGLEPQHIYQLLTLLRMDAGSCDRVKVLVTLANASAFAANQDLIREYGGLPIIAGLLRDPVPDTRVHALNALNNLSMNVANQELLKTLIPQVLEMIEVSPVNSDLQLAALRLLTNLSVTNSYHHAMSNSVTLFLSLLVVSNEELQTQALKLLVNISSNPDVIEEIVQSQAPASLALLFDLHTSPAVLLRLLAFVGNLRMWRLSAAVESALEHRRDSVYRVLLSHSSQLQHRLPQLLQHRDAEVRMHAARLAA